MATHRRSMRLMCILVVLNGLATMGCQSLHQSQRSPIQPEIHRIPPLPSSMPRELSKVVLPDYTIEPPDILAIEAINAIPKSPYELKTLDTVTLFVIGTLPESPIAGLYAIEPGGTINLGVPYGGVRVVGMTVDQAREAILDHLKRFLQAPDVSLSLAQIGASQQVIGQYLVGPDGTVTLGIYGGVPVVGLTVEGAKVAIEHHLSQYLDSPEISLSVLAYNSKVYYTVLEGAGLGDGIYRNPVTGNETVLDAIAQINGLQQVSSKKIWIARPTRDHRVQILPVDYLAITKHADPTTNYQLLPGDRVFISEDKFVAFDTKLSKVLTPFERMMGFSLLGVGTVTRFSGAVLKGGGTRGIGFGFGGF